MDDVLAGIKTTLISLYISTRALEWPDALSMSSNILKGISFCWAVGINSRLKIFIKPCCKQLCSHPGFVVPFAEHRQSRFSIIIKNPRIFRMVNDNWLELKVTGCISLTRESACPLKPGIDFSSVAMNVLDALLPIEGCFVYIEDLLFSVATFINYLS